MIIRKMTATYGRLRNESLELSPGLNIIRAPNESGKSTWCSFIKSMLYGVDSSAREKGGVKPDKVKFAPWSGSPMAGTMELEAGGRELTITRSGKESAPMRELTVTLSGTADIVEDIGRCPGEALLEIPREVFERSAFIGQGSVAVSAGPELEKRIAAIVQTGDENSSFTDGEEKLRAAMRKRRHNRSGRLPEIEKELSEAGELLAEIESEGRRGQLLEQAKNRAVERRKALTDKVAEIRRDLRKQSLDALNISRGAVKEAEEAQQRAAEAVTRWEESVKVGPFGGMTLEKSRLQADEDLEKLSFSKNYIKRGARKASLILALAFLAAAAAFELLTASGAISLPGLWAFVPRVGLGLAALFFLVRTLMLNRLMKLAGARSADILAKYGCESSEDIMVLLREHEAALESLAAAEREKSLTVQNLERARENQAALEDRVLRELDFSAGGGPAAEAAKQLEEAENELHRLREQLAQWEGRQNALGTGEELREKISALREEHERLTLEYEALALAAETLREAGEEIQNRLTPQLSRRATEIFARLTGGRYEAIALDRQLKAAARLYGDPISRESAFLSVGALDQLYLAVRLAICELALPEDNPCPLILDDALVNFDDQRCQLALELLREMSQKRQILLFTCHGREAAIAGQYGDVNVIDG